MKLATMFDLTGKVAVITGGAGILGEALCRTLAANGVKVAAIGRPSDRLDQVRDALRESGGQGIAVTADCLDRKQLDDAAKQITDKFGHVDFLMNFAGGNRPDATTSSERTFFDIPKEALEYAVDLNLLGTVLPCQVFGKIMAQQKEGSIINISSMAAIRPLTRIVGYSAAKAAVDNFTRWLAVHCAVEYSPRIRVNALAPGFFLTEQNRYLLTQKTGMPTERGESIINHTPMGRFGTPEDLFGAAIWLLSPSASFVTGIVVPIDGGFSAFSGV